MGGTALIEQDLLLDMIGAVPRRRWKHLRCATNLAVGGTGPQNRRLVVDVNLGIHAARRPGLVVAVRHALSLRAIRRWRRLAMVHVLAMVAVG